MKQVPVFLCLVGLSLAGLVKREAEADADADAYYGYGAYGGHSYGRGYGLKPFVDFGRGHHGGYHGHGHSHVAVVPTVQRSCHTEVEVVTSQVCHAVPEQVCHDVPEQVCHTETDSVVETTYVEKCQDIVTQHCSQTHQTVHTSSAVVGHAVGHAVAGHAVAAPAVGVVGRAGLVGHHLGKREAEAEADAEATADADADADPGLYGHYGHARSSAPACHAVTEKQCQQVPVQSARPVARQVCNTVSRPVCNTVSRQECSTVSRQECTTVSRQECHPVHQEVPREVCADHVSATAVQSTVHGYHGHGGYHH